MISHTSEMAKAANPGKGAAFNSTTRQEQTHAHCKSSDPIKQIRR